MAELLERAVDVREVSGSSPVSSGHNNLCSDWEHFWYISFCKAVKRQQFLTLNKHTIQNQEQQRKLSLQTFYKLELHLGLFPADVAHFLSNNQ